MMKAAIAHSPRLFHRVRQLLIVHTPQSHLASFRESAVFAIPSCSSLSCSSCCSTSGLAATCLRNHPPVRRNRSICWGLLPPSSRQKYFPACSPVPSSSGTRPPPTLPEDEHADSSIVHIWGLDNTLPRCIFMRLCDTLRIVSGSAMRDP